MRYPPDQKKKAKQAILQAGASTLRTTGFNGVGVDGLAAAAGVTSGAFYSNFASKEALLKDVIEAFLGNPFIDADSGTLVERQERLKSYLKMYISSQHCADPANGCVMPTLSADVSRSGASIRKAYQRKMTDLIGKMSLVMGGPSGGRESKAWTVLSLMIGAVSIARALPAGDTADKVLQAALDTAISIVDQR
jgi:TetR/AcrR family transcriptional repressor of nem operon